MQMKRRRSAISPRESTASAGRAVRFLDWLARPRMAIGLSNILFASLLVFALWQRLPHWQLAGWFAVTLAVAATTVRGLPINVPSRYAGALRAVTLGALWAMPALVFAGAVDPTGDLVISILTIAMMATATLVSATAPISLLLFLGLTTSALAMLLLRTQQPWLALLPCCCGFAFALGGQALARLLDRHHGSQSALVDRNETISLLLREFEQEAASWLWQTDAAKRLIDVSSGLARALGRADIEIDGLSLPALLTGEPLDDAAGTPELSAIVERLNGRQSFSDLPLPIRVDGEIRWWSLSGMPRFDEHGQFTGFRGVSFDVTEKQRSANAIDRLAHFDALTGLANRVHLIDALRTALGRAQRNSSRTALLLVDLDRFKPVNDTLGHPIGDMLLRQVADRLRHLLNAGELAGRLGGDEFAILIRAPSDHARIDGLAAAVIDALARPFEVDGNVIRIGASVGSVIGPKDGRTVDTLIRNADLALYHAKSEGRGMHRAYEPKLRARAEKRRAIEAGLRTALEEGGFTLVYQPMVGANHGRVEAFEALLRWSHPDFGAISPAEFMPIAEQARLSGPIGAWVLRVACEEAARWPDPVRVCVNLSIEQLLNPELTTMVLSALSHSGLLAARLELELAERVLLDHAAGVEPVLQRLATLGVRIAVDDFGTGQSALGHLAKGRFGAVKIDHSLVHAASDNEPHAVAQIRAVVAFANSLGIVTVAEGVETRRQAERSGDLGCTLVQGRHICHPIPAVEAAAIVATPLRATG